MSDTVRMIYIGRRPTGRTLGYAWIEENDSDDRMTVFGKVKGNAVGYVYEVKVERDEDGSIRSAYMYPAYTGERHGDVERIAAWQAVDQAHRSADRLRLAENRAKRGTELDRALDPLRDVLRTAKNLDEVELILSGVRRKLINEWARGALS